MRRNICREQISSKKGFSAVEGDSTEVKQIQTTKKDLKNYTTPYITKSYNFVSFLLVHHSVSVGNPRSGFPFTFFETSMKLLFQR